MIARRAFFQKLLGAGLAARLAPALVQAQPKPERNLWWKSDGWSLVVPCASDQRLHAGDVVAYAGRVSEVGFPFSIHSSPHVRLAREQDPWFGIVARNMEPNSSHVWVCVHGRGPVKMSAK